MFKIWPLPCYTLPGAQAGILSHTQAVHQKYGGLPLKPIVDAYELPWRAKLISTQSLPRPLSNEPRSTLLEYVMRNICSSKVALLQVFVGTRVYFKTQAT